MAIAIKVTLQPNGNLLFQADNETRSDLAHVLKTQGWQAAEGDFLELIRGEYSSKAPGREYFYGLEHLNPADIFALTDCPMLADTVRDDDDAVRVYGPVWGFPDYQIRDHIEELAHKGRTEFEPLIDFGPDGATFPSRHDPENGALCEHLAVRAFETCLNGQYVFEDVPDLHEDGKTIRRLVDFAPPPPRPAVGDLFAGAV